MTTLPVALDPNSPASPPNPMDPSLKRRLIDIHQNKMEKDHAGRGTLIKSNVPNAVTREGFAVRLKTLTNKIVPCEAKTLKKLIGYCFLAYPSLHAETGDEVLQRIGAYAVILRDMPEWALREAFKKIADGHTDSRYVPTALEIKLLAQASLNTFRDEKFMLEVIRDATIVDDPRPPLEQRIEFVDRLWTNGLREEIPAGSQSPEESERRDAARKETAAANTRLMRRWQEQSGVDPDKTVHSPFLLGLYGLTGMFAPDRGAAHQEGKDGHSANEPDRSRTA